MLIAQVMICNLWESFDGDMAPMLSMHVPHKDERLGSGQHARRKALGAVVKNIWSLTWMTGYHIWVCGFQLGCCHIGRWSGAIAGLPNVSEQRFGAEAVPTITGRGFSSNLQLVRSRLYLLLY